MVSLLFIVSADQLVLVNWIFPRCALLPLLLLLLYALHTINFSYLSLIPTFSFLEIKVFFSYILFCVCSVLFPSYIGSCLFNEFDLIIICFSDILPFGSLYFIIQRDHFGIIYIFFNW